MAFEWSQCTAIYNKKSKYKASDCFKGIYTFKYCLTPNIIAGLKIWLYNKIKCYGRNRFTQSDVMWMFISSQETDLNISPAGMR